MADNYLITGYWGEPHVTAENDRGIHAGIFGTGRFVLPVGEQFRAEYIGNNTIRMYDGKLMDNGAAAGIPVGEYVDLLIANAGQGMKRNDLIVFQYSQDASTLIESGKFVVVRGTETSGTASDPELAQEDLLSGNATFDQMALWRVSVSGATIAAPVKVFSVGKSSPEYLPLSGGAMSGAINFSDINHTGFRANGMRFGAFKFDANTTCRIYIGDFNKWSMLVSITENKGGLALYHLGGTSPTNLQTITKIAGSVAASFAIDGDYLVITFESNWSTGWYISNGAYTDMSKG